MGCAVHSENASQTRWAVRQDEQKVRGEVSLEKQCQPGFVRMKKLISSFLLIVMSHHHSYS